MSMKLSAGRSLLDLLLLMAIGLAPVVCGLLILMVQVDRKLDEFSRFSATEAIHGVDQLIQVLHDSSSRSLHLSGRPCLEVAQQLRSQVVAVPRLRSLALTRGNQAYCDSVDGEQARAIDQKLFFNQRLWLAEGDGNCVNTAVLHYRLQERPYGVIAQVDARMLQAELLGFENGIVLVLEFGPNFLWAQGDADGGMPDQREHQVRATSEQFGYSVQAGYPKGHTRQEVLQSMVMTLPSLILVGILTAGIAHWGMRRQQ